MSEIEYIVGEAREQAWSMINPTVYYLDGKPYGLIGTARSEHIVVIYSCAINDGIFTKSMIRDIKKIYQEDSVCLVTDSESRQDYMKSLLERYGFTFISHIDDNGNKMLYSFHTIGG